MACSVAAAVAGIALAYLFYVRSPAIPEDAGPTLPRRLRTLLNKYWVDEIYDATVVAGDGRARQRLLALVDVLVIDGVVNGVGSVVRAQSAILAPRADRQRPALRAHVPRRGDRRRRLFRVPLKARRRP